MTIKSKSKPTNNHPSRDAAKDSRLVKEVYEILRASSQWNEMALLIIYNEHGGLYDYVPTLSPRYPSLMASLASGHPSDVIYQVNLLFCSFFVLIDGLWHASAFKINFNLIFF